MAPQTLSSFAFIPIVREPIWETLFAKSTQLKHSFYVPSHKPSKPAFCLVARNGGPFHQEPSHPRFSFLRAVDAKSAASTSSFKGLKSGGGEYEFADEGGDVQLRVPIPAHLHPITASQISVETEEDSLVISASSAQTGAPTETFFAARPLFGRVNPSDTLWYLDDSCVVVNLKKIRLGKSNNNDSHSSTSSSNGANIDSSSSSFVPWPGLLRQLATLGPATAALLKSCPISIVGQSSAASSAVATCLASCLGYVPLSTTSLIESAIQTPLSKLEEEEGVAGVQDVEVAILKSLATNLRVVVSTIGGGWGAAASEEGWRQLYGSMSIRLQFSDEGEDCITASSSLYSQADAVIKLSLPEAEWKDEMAEEVAAGICEALCSLVENDPLLPGKKSFYVRMGCRGDWPDLQPPGWQPSSDLPEIGSEGSTDARE